MLDFIKIEEKTSRGNRIIFPIFIVKNTKDLMIKGKSFYAIWDEGNNTWSTDEIDVQRLVDKELEQYCEDHHLSGFADIYYLSNYNNGMWSSWKKYCKELKDQYVELDDSITFSNTPIRRNSYVTKRLPYALEESDISAYDQLMNVLYAPEERTKLEWAIGSIIAGDSKRLQKFIVIYGPPKSGKSTILNIIEDMFRGYCSVFDSKALVSSSNAFALESLKDNPLIAIQQDGDLSRIEDNTKLNSIVSHESIIVNEKFKSAYSTYFRSFLFMGTNKPVRITDAKSGIIRRLIDVTPTGNTVDLKTYDILMNEIRYEYGGIAQHCLDVYSELGYGYYDGYVATSMIAQTNVFHNFIVDNLDFFLEEGEHGFTLREVWMRYKEYCQNANVAHPLQMINFKYELQNYFEEFYEKKFCKSSVYMKFKKDRFIYTQSESDSGAVSVENTEEETWLDFKEQSSIFDDIFKDCPAQLANNDIPSCKWDKCKTTLKDIDTRETHYILPPDTLIGIDFDLKKNGIKDYETNKKEALKFPPTYAELSKSGGGIHLMYWYTGDVEELSRLIKPDIEVKIFKGKSSLRRKLTKCNNLEIATISSGLPIKEAKKMVQASTIKNERELRNFIKKNLRKEIHPYTKPSIDYIYAKLEEVYESGMKYDVRDMRPEIQAFALKSSHQAENCLKVLSKMKFCSESESKNVEEYKDETLVFFDVEVFPNLFIVVYKAQGPDKQYVRMINPTPDDIYELTKLRLIGFNNRNYDNHILYARMMGYSNKALFELSQNIINSKDPLGYKFSEAYNLSYTDIYDFLSASNKMSLKKWEIKLGIHHQESGYKWDEEVPEEHWDEIADYCCNDVMATEAVFDANQSDWISREILADLAGLTVNDTTNKCTTQIIVGDDPNPQSQFVYTDLSTIFPGYEFSEYGINRSKYDEGIEVKTGKSLYRGEDPSEGGYVYANYGIHTNVALLDVASMHPHSAKALNVFGDIYTKRYYDLVEARMAIKHKDYEKASTMLDGMLAKHIQRVVDGELSNKALANALKTAINSVYGLTSTSYMHKLRDPRNKDNIIAKYGALFMINLKHEVQDRGYTVVHIKTDSIKIADADDNIIEFVKNYGKQYGFTFEHEATYDKMCLVNDAVYIAHEVMKDGEPANEWTATGAQFAVPYVFKTLFSHEEVTFNDLCETFSVTTALYLDFNEDKGDDHEYVFVGKVGLFTPVVAGAGGGILHREKDGKYHAANGTKRPNGEPYRWMESEMVKTLGLEDKIDLSYYNQLVDDAVATISKYGDFEIFVSEEFPMNRPIELTE